MINISGCEFSEFKEYMIKQYGEKQFSEGFEILQENRKVAFEINGEQKLMEMLNHLDFANEDAKKTFIDFSTTYLVV